MRPALRSLLAGALNAAFLLSGATSACGQTEPVRAPVAVTVNSVDRGVRLVLVRTGDVLIARSDIDALGLTAVIAALAPPPGPYVSLNALKPALTYVFELAKAALAITVQPQYLPVSSVDLRTVNAYPISRVPSAFLNYGLVTAHNERGDLATEIGSTLGAGVASATFNVIDDQYRATNVNWTFEDPAKLSQFVAGDAYVDLGDLGGSSNFRGLTFQRDFGLNPYLNSRLVSRTLTGYVATPSTADLYVNGRLVTQLQLAPGAFNLTNVPQLTGVNNAQVVIRDAFGNVQTVSQTFYQGLRVLPRGVDDFAYSAGEPVDGAGKSTGPISLAGRYSRGVSDFATLGGGLEASHDLVNGGPAVALPTRAGEFDLLGRFSSGDGSGGSAGELLYNYTSRALSIGFGCQLQSPHYADISLAPAADRDLSNLFASLGFTIARQGISLHVSSSDDRDQGRVTGYGAQTTVALTRELSLWLDYEHQRGVATARSDFYTTLLLPLGRQSETLASVSNDASSAAGSTTYSIERSARPDVPLGFDVSVTQGDGQGANLEQATYETTFGTYTARRTEFNGISTAQLNAAGAIVYADGRLIPSRPVTESYVVADSGGISGVPVFANGVRIGETNKAGLLVIPDVFPYYQNAISIDTAKQALDLTFDTPEKNVAPAYLSAAVVRFNGMRTQSFVGRVAIIVDGKPQVPQYGVLTIFLPGGKTVTSELGDDGAFYFSNVPPGPHAAHVENTADCDLTVVIPNTKDFYVRLGTLSCTANVSPSPSPSPRS
jgi:outer membrane usher protein